MLKKLCHKIPLSVTEGFKGDKIFVPSSAMCTLEKEGEGERGGTDLESFDEIS